MRTADDYGSSRGSRKDFKDGLLSPVEFQLLASIMLSKARANLSVTAAEGAVSQLLDYKYYTF